MKIWFGGSELAVSNDAYSRLSICFNGEPRSYKWSSQPHQREETMKKRNVPCFSRGFPRVFFPGTFPCTARWRRFVTCSEIWALFLADDLLYSQRPQHCGKKQSKKTMWKDTTRNQQKAPEIGNRNWKLLEIISGRETSQNSSGKWWRESNGAMTR